MQKPAMATKRAMVVLSVLAFLNVGTGDGDGTGVTYAKNIQ